MVKEVSHINHHHQKKKNIHQQTKKTGTRTDKNSGWEKNPGSHTVHRKGGLHHLRFFLIRMFKVGVWASHHHHHLRGLISSVSFLTRDSIGLRARGYRIWSGLLIQPIVLLTNPEARIVNSNMRMTLCLLWSLCTLHYSPTRVRGYD